MYDNGAAAQNMAIGTAMGVGQANAYAGAMQASNKIKPPDTIASAVGDIDRLNERLSALLSNLHLVASTIGAPSPLTGVGKGQDTPEPSGHVYRLNAGATAAHTRLSEIEGVLSAIQRSLG